MVGGDRRVFVARMSLLPETADFVGAFCTRHGIGGDDSLRLTLIVAWPRANSACRGRAGLDRF